jgi:hypothetical protein
MKSEARPRPDDPRLSAADASIIKLEECVSAIENGGPQTKDQWLATSLLKSARRAFVHLLCAWAEDTNYSAWACRNLLELNIIALHVVQSPTERRRFISDFYVDAAAYTQATKTISAELVPEMNPEDHNSVLGTIATIKTERQFTDSRYVPVRVRAEKVGRLDHYLAMNTVCSKMVHPTSLSILSVEFEDRAQANRDILLLSGSVYLTDLVTIIIAFIQTLIES